MEHKKRLITGIFGILLSFMMVLGFIPLPGAIKVAKAADTWTSLQAVFTSGGEISLSNDVEASGSDSQLIVAPGKTVTLNLNGHTIDRKLSSPGVENGRVIKVNGTLIINDTSGEGKIKGGYNSNVGRQGDEKQGGAILVDGGTLTINGGSIQDSYAMFGGGIQVYGGTVTMTGGKITNNTAYNGGGGIYVNNGSTFTMSGGEISSNSISGTNPGSGGGVYVGYNGSTNTFTMESGTIKNNHAPWQGGGVYLAGKQENRVSEATVTGGSIVNNTCINAGGGIFVSENSVIEIAEKPVIINNTRQSNETSIADNVYFPYVQDKFTVTAALTSGAQIGVSKNMGWPISDKIITNGYGSQNTTSPASFFTSDNPDYTIGLSNGEAQIKVHSHSFTYSGSGTSITATCGTSGCSLTENKITLTIVAPARTTYGGSESEQATLGNLSAFKAATGKNIAATDIKYVGRNTTTYEESSTAPTAAGDYTAKITITDVSLTGGGTGNVTASLNYTISKAEPTATAPTATATYGQTLSNVVLTNPDGNTPGTWAFVDAGTTSVGSVGNHTFKANFTPTDTTIFNGKSNVDITVTVGKAANPTTVINTVALVKGGNSKDLANLVTKNGATGTVTYAFSGDEKGCTLNGSMLTSGNSTGNVYVTVDVAADDNYNALEQKTITVFISDKMTQTITASDMTVTYGDTGKSISASASGGGALSYAVKDGSADYIDVDASTGALTIKKVGTATVIVTAAETNTYTQAAKEVTVTINKANAVAATVTANNRTYDGTDKPLVNVTGEATGGEMWYALGTATEATQPYTTDIPTGTNAGTYYVWYKVVGDENHFDSTPVCVTVTINQPVEISHTVTFKVVNGAWNDGTTADKKVILSGHEGDTLKLTENQIPAVGSKPNDNCKAGSWDVIPTTSMAITADRTFTYTYGNQGTTNEEVIQEDNTPKANVSGLDNNLTNNIMTPQEKAMVNSGQNSILKLIMKNIDASVPQQDKNLTEEEIKKVSNNANVAMFLDLSLWLTIGHNYSRQIESTGEHKIGVELEVPEDKRAPAGVIRTFLVVQIHNNASNIIARTTAIHIPLVISDFSTYALAYVDEPAEKVGFYSGLKITQKNDKIKISWDKTEGVAKYEAYVTYCGKKYPKKPTKSTTSNSVTIKKIKDKKIDFTKNFKLYVAAYDGNGNIIGKSVNAHFAGKDSKEYKNPKDIKLKTKSITIAKGQTSKIKASVKMEKGKGKELSDNHAPKFRYKTTNTNVATVDKKGKVTGVNSGTCIIYVYAKNGRAKKVAVTVN